MSVSVRPYGPEDRDEAAALVGGDRALHQERGRLHVARAGSGALVGVASWVEVDGGEPRDLAVVLAPGEPVETLYRLVRACVEDALARGYRKGSFTLRDEALLHRLQRDFDIEPARTGRNPRTGATVEWSVTVDLRDALEQLGRMT